MISIEHRKLTLNFIFDSLPLIQNSKFNYFLDSYEKLFLIMDPPLENSRTRITVLGVVLTSSKTKFPQ